MWWNFNMRNMRNMERYTWYDIVVDSKERKMKNLEIEKYQK